MFIQPLLGRIEILTWVTKKYIPSGTSALKFLLYPAIGFKLAIRIVGDTWYQSILFIWDKVWSIQLGLLDTQIMTQKQGRTKHWPLSEKVPDNKNQRKTQLFPFSLSLSLSLNLCLDLVQLLETCFHFVYVPPVCFRRGWNIRESLNGKEVQFSNWII